METKRIAVVGYGGRGGIYGEFALQFPEKFQLVAAADINEMPLQSAIQNAQKFDVKGYSVL